MLKRLVHYGYTVGYCTRRSSQTAYWGVHYYWIMHDGRCQMLQFDWLICVWIWVGYEVEWYNGEMLTIEDFIVKMSLSIYITCNMFNDYSFLFILVTQCFIPFLKTSCGEQFVVKSRWKYYWCIWTCKFCL